MSENKRSLLGAIGVLSGGIIGAGIFSLPYVASEAGLFVALVLLVLATTAYCYIHLMYADIVAGSSEQHRFVGYISRYLGKRWFYLGVAMTVIEMVFVLTIYLILSVSFMQLVVPNFPTLFAVGLFWLIGVATMLMRLKKLAVAETVATLGILAIIGSLVVASLPQLSTLVHLPLTSSRNILLPLSALFFALSGRVAIPAVVNLLRERKSAHIPLIRRAIIAGTILPGVVYALFIVAVLALSGTVSQDAVTGLLGALPQWLVFCIGLLGILSLWSSYILVGRDVNETLQYDLDMPSWLRYFIVLIVPLVLYALGFSSFIGLVSFIGGIFLALEGVFIALLWRGAHIRHRLAGLVHISRSTLLLLWLLFTAALIGVLISGYY
jgi:amino acid permease